MHMKKLFDKIARLEFVNDQIATELHNIDALLRSIGFSEGLESVKSAAVEIYEHEHAKKPRQKPKSSSEQSF